MNYTQKLCISCANVFSLDNINDKIICPDCGFELCQEEYKRLLKYSKTVAYYGIMYREEYELQIAKKGKIFTHYALIDPSAILCLIVMSTLSGIIGGFSYDLVKTAIRKLLKKIKRINDNAPQLTMNEIDLYIKYVEDFCNGFKGVHPEVRKAIKHEMITWERTEKSAQPLFESKEFKELMESLEEDASANIEEIEEDDDDYKVIKYIVCEKDFEGFWKKL